MAVPGRVPLKIRVHANHIAMEVACADIVVVPVGLQRVPQKQSVLSATDVASVKVAMELVNVGLVVGLEYSNPTYYGS